MPAISRKNLIYLALIAIALTYLMQSVAFKYTGDDGYFANALNNRDLFDFLSGRYTSWSGRVFIEAILVLTINIPFVPYVIVIFATVLLCYFLSRLLSLTPEGSLAGTTAILTLLMLNYHSTNQAITWITGAYNYVLPISIGVASFVIHFENRSKKSPRTLITSCLMMIFACNNEQFGACALLAMLAVIALKTLKRTYESRDLILLSSIILGTTIVLAAPGNYYRLAAEIPRWMPDFANYGIFTKMTFSIDRLNSHILNNENYLFVICCSLVLLHILMKRQPDMVDFLISLVMSIAVLRFAFTTFPNRSSLDFSFINTYASPEIWTGVSLYISYLMSLLCLSSLIIHSVRIANDSSEVSRNSIIIVIGILSFVMIGLSPTVYESGTRVAFIFDISIASLAAMTAKKILLK